MIDEPRAQSEATRRVLVIGATGFVGRNLLRAMEGGPWRVVCTSRRPEEASRRAPNQEFIGLDVERPEMFSAALAGADAVIYLVHNMAGGEGYEGRERAAAEALAEAAAAAEVRRLVYLGGVAPQGEPSRHLRSRLATGAILRAGAAPCFELRAAMIIGAESASWQMCRDLAARLPLMLLPRWLESRFSPVAVEDVCAAITRCLDLPAAEAGCYDLPGPEVMTARECLMRIAGLLGTRPRALRVPVLTPKLSSLWLRFVTRADYSVASELVEGMSHDLMPSQPSFWRHMPERKPISFQVSALRALVEDRKLPLSTLALERCLKFFARKAPPGAPRGG